MTLFAFKILYICYNFLETVSAVNNVDTREKIADLEAKIVDLEKQNVGLKNKVQFITSFQYNYQIHHNMYFILSFKQSCVSLIYTV